MRFSPLQMRRDLLQYFPTIPMVRSGELSGETQRVIVLRIFGPDTEDADTADSSVAGLGCVGVRRGLCVKHGSEHM